MKPVRFDYAVPRTLEEAADLLADGAAAKIIAGAQTLGPMLNLRLVQPELLVDITRIPELSRVEEDGDWTVYGACITHAAIEDGRVPDRTGGVLGRIAAGIAYRAVRTRGTIGGSLAHADPAADWLSALMALGAEVVVFDGSKRRAIAVQRLMTAVFETALAPGEILEAVRVPRLRDASRFGYHKICRKTGEFAEAIGVVLMNPSGKFVRAIVGATGAAPIVIEDASVLTRNGEFDRVAVANRLRRCGMTDAYEIQIHAVALERAAAEARA